MRLLHASLVLAHNEPKHFGRLVHALAQVDGYVFVHIDRKADVRVFEQFASDRIRFIEDRVSVFWGGFSMVRATLNLMRNALSFGVNFERMSLLSGHCYPIMSASERTEFFHANLDAEFITCLPVPCEANGKTAEHVDKKHIGMEGPKLYVRAMRRLRDRGLNVLPRLRRFEHQFPAMKPFGGDQWWSLTGDACRYVLEFSDANPRFMRYMKHCRIPDELYFQTVIGNSRFRERIRRSITYVDWWSTQRKPADLTPALLERVIKERTHGPLATGGDGPVVFCRKCAVHSDQVVPLIEGSWRH